MTKQKARGFSLIELLIVVAIILIIASIAIPNLLRSKMAANRAAAVANLRDIHNSQAVYILQFGNGQNFAGSLAQLGPGTPCDAANACLLDNVLGCAVEPCVKGGYEYFLNSPAVASYVAAATPISWANTGQDNFCSTDTGVVRSQIGAGGSLGAIPLHANCENPALWAPLH